MSFGKSCNLTFRLRLVSVHCNHCQKIQAKRFIQTKKPIRDWKKTSSSSSPTSAGAIFVGTIPVLTFGLGVWQYYRRKWKLDLIASVEKKTELEDPIELPHSVGEMDFNDLEYSKVSVTGEFDHSREIHLGIRRNLLPEYTPMGSNAGLGFYVITPFKVKDSPLTILVNRGWLPIAMKDKIGRPDRVNGEVTIVGLFRKTEWANLTIKDQPEKNNPNWWSRRNIEDMAKYLGTDPVLIDANFESSVRGGPIGGQTVIDFKNRHMEYIITWWSLSLITGYLWYTKYISKTPLQKVVRSSRR